MIISQSLLKEMIKDSIKLLELYPLDQDELDKTSLDPVIELLEEKQQEIDKVLDQKDEEIQRLSRLVIELKNDKARQNIKEEKNTVHFKDVIVGQDFLYNGLIYRKKDITTAYIKPCSHNAEKFYYQGDFHFPRCIPVSLKINIKKY